MCKFLKVSRSSYYYEVKEKNTEKEEQIEKEVRDVYDESRNNFGARKIRKELMKRKHTISRRKVARIMRKLGLVSSYTVAQYKNYKSRVNEDPIPNIVDREFNNRRHCEVVVSDLTYVRVDGKWNYICVIIDLFNREIIGHAVGKSKDANLVKQAIYSINQSLHSIELFHSDRGSEFKNKEIDEILRVFGIERSLSAKGTPYDNAVAEAAYKVIKIEFVRNRNYKSLEELKLEFYDYVNWYNNKRIHGSLDYLTPKEYKEQYVSL